MIKEIKNFNMNDCNDDMEYEKWNIEKIEFDDYNYTNIEIIKKFRIVINIKNILLILQ